MSTSFAPPAAPAPATAPRPIPDPDGWEPLPYAVEPGVFPYRRRPHRGSCTGQDSTETGTYPEPSGAVTIYTWCQCGLMIAPPERTSLF